MLSFIIDHSQISIEKNSKPLTASVIGERALGKVKGHRAWLHRIYWKVNAAVKVLYMIVKAKHLRQNEREFMMPIKTH